jgi:hypothetical protein
MISPRVLQQLYEVQRSKLLPLFHCEAAALGEAPGDQTSWRDRLREWPASLGALHCVSHALF